MVDEKRKYTKDEFKEIIFKYSKELEDKYTSMLGEGKKDDIKKDLDDLKKEAEDEGNNTFMPLYGAMTQYFVDGSLPAKDYAEKVSNFAYDTSEIWDSEIGAAVMQGLQNQVVAETAAETGATIEEVETVVNEFEINEEEDWVNDAEPFDLKYAKTDKIKKVYNYKVEQKISTGGKIPDLDKFLEIIHPALDQLIIMPHRIRDKAIDLGNAALEKYESWREQSNQNKDILESMQSMEHGGLKALPPGADIHTGFFNLKNNQKKLAGWANGYLCKLLNDRLAQEKADDLTKYKEEFLDDTGAYTKPEADIEAEFDALNGNKYDARTKFFDFKRDTTIPRKVLADVAKDLLKASGSRDSDKKLTPEGKKRLQGLMAMIDLFNKEDKDKIRTYYTDLVEYIIKEADGRSNPNDHFPIEEDDKLIEEIDGKAEKDDIISKIASQINQNKK